MKRFILVGKVGKPCCPDCGDRLDEYIHDAEGYAASISLATGINCSVRVVDNSIHTHGYDWSEQVEVVAHTAGRFFWY